jgi:hypothetical protein
LLLQLLEIDRLCDELGSSEFTSAASPLIFAVGFLLDIIGTELARPARRWWSKHRLNAFRVPRDHGTLETSVAPGDV